MEVSVSSSLASSNEFINGATNEHGGVCKFQRVKKFAKYLPYWNLYEKEADEALDEIKYHLSVALRANDLHLEALYWLKRLGLYCSMYHIRLTKADHICIIKLVYQLVCRPHFEPRLKDLCCNMGFTLLTYRTLIDRTDIQLEWRPLYESFYAVTHNTARDNGFLRIPESLEQNFHSLITKLRNHFPESAFKEIWEEFRCYLCPHFREEDYMRFGLKFLSWFLPIYPINHADKCARECFDELLKLWHVFSNHLKYEVYFSSIFRRIARKWLGYVNWEPHMDHLFNSYMRCMSLPVAGFEGGEYDVDTQSRLSHYTEWIIATITPTSSTLDRLELLFSALSHFYHPSNSHAVSPLLNFVLAALTLNFFERIRDERFRKQAAGYGETPVEVRVTDKDIARFVDILLPVSLKALFQEGNNENVSNAIFFLSLMRPSKVIPPLLERFESACDSLIEPHRLTSCLTALSSVALPMLQSPALEFYPESRLECVDLIRATLPGLDVNDITKCKKSIEVIRNLVLLIRLEDVSSRVDDYTDPLERQLCLLTGQFEDVLMELMDRIFDLITNVSSAHAHEHRAPPTEASSREEDAIWDCIPLLMINVVQNCSIPLREKLWNRIMTFVKSSLFDSESIGGTIGSIIAVFAWFIPKKSIDTFLPFFVRTLRDQETNVDEERKTFFEGEKPDALLSWLLPCLFGIVDQNTCLMSWREELTYIARTLVRVRSSKVANYSALPIGSVLASLTIPRLKKCGDPVTPPNFPKRDWCVYQTYDERSHHYTQWYLPSESDFEFGHALVNEVLSYIFERIEGYMVNEVELGPTELEALMFWLQGILAGGVYVFPLWTDEIVPLDEEDLRPTMTKLTHYVCNVNDDCPVITFRGGNVRLAIANLLSRLLEYLPTQKKDNAVALTALVSVLQHCICLEDEMKKLDNTNDYHKILKLFFKDGTQAGKLKPACMRMLQLESLHFKRFSILPKRLDRTTWRFCQQLLELAISPYEDVRRATHKCLHGMWTRFMSVAEKILRTGIIPYLRNGDDHPEHKFQGALEYLSNSEECQLYYTSWLNRRQIYAAMVSAMQCKHADKPEISALIAVVMDNFVERSDNINLCDSDTDEKGVLLATADQLCPAATVKEEDVAVSRRKSKLRFDKRLKNYICLIDEVVAACDIQKSTWNAINQAINMLPLQEDGPIPTSLISFTLSNLIHPVPTVGTDAANLLNSILWKFRRQRRKVLVPIPDCVVRNKELANNLAPGIREDNKWRIYRFESKPLFNDDHWEQSFFYGKDYLGYKWWPVQLAVKDWKDSPREVDLPRDDDDLIYVFFQNPAIWDHLRRYLTSVYEEDESPMVVDDVEDELDFDLSDFDKFPSSQLAYWLSRNYGDVFNEQILNLIVDLLQLASDDKRSVCHKVSSSLLFGLISGSKYWSREMVRNLWLRLVPDFMDLIFEKTTESQENYWLLRFSDLLVETSFEPQMMHPLIDYLFERLQAWKHELYKEYLCYYWLCQFSVSISWRGDAIVKRLLELFPEYHQHDYKRFREVSWIMLRASLACEHDGFRGMCSRDELMEGVILPLLARHTLTVVQSKGIRASAITVKYSQRVSAIPNFKPTEDSSTAQLAIEVILNALTMRHLSYSAPKSHMWTSLLILSDLRSCVGGEDQQLELPLYRHLSCCASAVVNEANYPSLAATIPLMAKHSSWKARIALLDFLQGVIFNNLYTFSQEQRPVRVQGIVLDLLRDESVEVRKHAATTLAGLMQCGFINHSESLSTTLKQWSNRGVKRPHPSNSPSTNGGDNNLVNGFRFRHSGVLGLGAIVNAFPYDVPSFVPDILMEICRHATDPEPVKSSVKETVRNFTKTHHETWHFQKHLFSDDQLLILTDLLVSPNYYA